MKIMKFFPTNAKYSQGLNKRSNTLVNSAGKIPDQYASYVPIRLKKSPQNFAQISSKFVLFKITQILSHTKKKEKTNKTKNNHESL